jgi:hypothetical protein
MLMQRTNKGKVERREMPDQLATSPAARMGGWVRVEALQVPVPEITAPVTPQDAEPIGDATIAPVKRGRKKKH